MGWKGTVRSIGAAVRAAERESKRREREFEREQKQLAKMEELERAAETAAAYDQYMVQIQSIHKDCSEPVDWIVKSSQSEPKEPEPTFAKQSKALHSIETYRPNVFARLFRREESQMASLEEQLEAAKSEDAKTTENEHKSWQEKHSKWKEEVEYAKRLIAGESEVKLKVIKKYQTFSDIEDLGSDVSFNVTDGGVLNAELKVHGSDIVPDESYSLLQSGKLSVKKLPRGKFYEAYQDYVCSCVLRIGRELFAILPDTVVVVTATDELLDTKTGHQEDTPILSVVLSRSTLETMNMDRIDPSESLGNFVHNMNFKKTGGFSAVDIVNMDAIE
ncbi:MAG: hypothetical protein GKR90_14300 [Pseudomonadales bacterium]|nr:hypothetical protein [Pseudomonadales bacterium]